jgi:hypothetical protein
MMQRGRSVNCERSRIVVGVAAFVRMRDDNIERAVARDRSQRVADVGKMQRGLLIWNVEG